MNIYWFRVDFSPEDLAQRRHTDLFERFEHLSHLYPDSPHCALFAQGDATGISHYFVAVSGDRQVEVSHILAEFGAGRCDPPARDSGCVLMLGQADAVDSLLQEEA